MDGRILDVIKKKVNEATELELEEALRIVEKKLTSFKPNQNNNHRKKDGDDGSNVSLSGTPKQTQRKTNKDEHMSVNVDTHGDNPQNARDGNLSVRTRNQSNNDSSVDSSRGRSDFAPMTQINSETKQ